MHLLWIILSGIVSSVSFADVSVQEKVNKVVFTSGIGEVAPTVGVEAYQRELEYDREDLALKQRATLEANLIINQIKSQILTTYENALSELKDQNLAAQKVKEAMDKDLALVNPEFVDEIKTLAFNTLKEIQQGSSSNVSLPKLENLLLKDIKARAPYLYNEQSHDDVIGGQLPPPTPEGIRDSERRSYSNKDELLKALVSDVESTRWVATSGFQGKSEEWNEDAVNVEIQVPFSFLGMTLDIGPKVSFKKYYKSILQYMGEGMSPELNATGHFDFLKRDEDGNPVLKNGVPQKRFIVFSCEVQFTYETELSAMAGLSFMWIAGGSYKKTQNYTHTVSKASRRIFVPEIVGGKTISLAFLQDICRNDFLKTKINNKMTVSDSLNVSMENAIRSLRVIGGKTQCAVDRHCYEEFKNNFAVNKNVTFPRCENEYTHRTKVCSVKGLEGASCSVIEKGQLVSSGLFEYDCDKGLECIKVQDAGWFQGWDVYRPAKGECRPKNPSNYVRPVITPAVMDVIL